MFHVKCNVSFHLLLLLLLLLKAFVRFDCVCYILFLFFPFIAQFFTSKWTINNNNNKELQISQKTTAATATATTTTSTTTTTLENRNAQHLQSIDSLQSAISAETITIALNSNSITNIEPTKIDTTFKLMRTPPHEMLMWQVVTGAFGSLLRYAQESINIFFCPM